MSENRQTGRAAAGKMVDVDPLELTDDQRFRAMKSRDSRFDGVFIVGVRTTGIYCRPSCPTPIQPLRKNVDFYRTTAAAQRAGLRSCKRCRPDATPGSPEWNMRGDLVGRAMQRLRSGYLDQGSVGDLARDLGVTERHLRRVLIDEVGAPPLSIARAHRAQTARTLIETTALKMSDVAFAAGFASLRQFNETIREVFAATPTELRRNRRANDAVGTASTMSIRLPYRSPLAGVELFRWHAGRSVAGVADGDETVHTTAVRFANGGGVLRLEPRDGWIDLHAELDDLADLAAAVSTARRLLDLDADPSWIDPIIAAVPGLSGAVDARPGLRSPGTVDGFATVIFAILGQQRSVAAARTIAGRIVDRCRGGEAGAELASFPGPAELAAADLHDLGLNGRAITTIHTVADLMVDREHELVPGADVDAVASELLEVHGIGPWTVNYIRMRVFADPDVFLAGDLIAERAASGLGLDAEAIERARPWRSYLTHHLWAASAELASKGTK